MDKRVESSQRGIIERYGAKGLLTGMLLLWAHGGYDVYQGQQDSDIHRIKFGINQIFAGSVVGALGVLHMVVEEADDKLLGEITDESE